MGFAGTQAHENFEAAVFEVTLEGHKCPGAAFFDLAEEAMDLRLMEEELAGPVRFRVGSVTVAVGRDMEGVEPSFAVFNPAKGVGEVAVASADRFDFRAGQDDSGFDRFQDRVVVASPAVVDLDGFQGASPRRPEGAFRKISWRGSYGPAWQRPRRFRRQ